MSKCIVTEPSFFEESVEDLAWVDAMVEDCPKVGREISGRFEMDLQSEASS